MVAGVGEEGLGENLVVPVDPDDVFLHHQNQQVVLVIRIELAGVRWRPSGAATARFSGATIVT